MTPAPIILFAYKRLDVLIKSIDALKNNSLAAESDLFIFSDAAKNKEDEALVDRVRAYLGQISGFKSMTIFPSIINKGLANSIIQGVSEIFANYGSIIVLEDDLVVSENFLMYMNSALTYYKDNSKVFSIAGYTVPIIADSDYPYDVYFTPRASSWGWASWKDRWEGIDWSVNDFESFKNDNEQKQRFNLGGSDMFDMLKKVMENKIDSWAIKWCYHQFKQEQFTVYPTISKIKNIGFNDLATNTNVYNRYASKFDDGAKSQFIFPTEVQIQTSLYYQFVDFYSKKTRLLGRIKTYLQRIIKFR